MTNIVGVALLVAFVAALVALAVKIARDVNEWVGAAWDLIEWRFGGKR